MAPEASYLSHPRYGYDVVVGTTQAAINSGLLNYLQRNPQPASTLCFLANSEGTPGDPISLEDLLKQTDGANPFEVPAGTDWLDSRVQKLFNARFMIGIKIQMGLPPGVLPKNLPAPVVELGTTATAVSFHMYCSQLTLIELTPPAWGAGQWNVYNQPSGQPWYVKTSVNIKTSDLDRNLNTEYFRNHPDERDAILEQLKNLSGTAFSLQQLLFELNSAVIQTRPQFEGVPPGSHAASIVDRAFVDVYSTNAQKKGLPLLSVNVVSKEPDPSQLQLTDIDKMVNAVVGSDGKPISSPTPIQVNATTLNYLCATGGHGLKPAAPFDWNWLEPDAISTASGIMAVQRNVIAAIILDQLRDFVKSSCFRHSVAVEVAWTGWARFEASVGTGATPQSYTITTTGPNVIEITHEAQSYDEDKAGFTNIYGALELKSGYKCTVNFQGTTVKITQESKLWFWMQYLNETDGFWPVRRTITDTYSISVDQNGNLIIGQPSTTRSSDDEEPDPSWFLEFFTDFDDMQEDIRDAVRQMTSTNLRTPPLGWFKSFIFPGGKVFAYKAARFSDHQDLCAAITYVNTDTNSVPASQPLSLPPNVPARNPDLSIRLKPSPRKLKGTAKARNIPRLEGSVFNGNTTWSHDRQEKANNIARTVSDLQVSSSSEMMDNYVQGQLVSPQEKFDTAQTSDGHALLFGIDTSGGFHVIEEQTDTQTGWVLTNLSSAVVKTKYPGAIVDTFDVGQSALDGSINLAMAVESGGIDHLFLSLSNPHSNMLWITKPSWVEFPFDAPNAPSRLSIVGIMFCETAYGEQYLIVDIDRSTESSVKHIERYRINTTASSGPFWVQMDVPIDIESGSYNSVIGRAIKETVDGIYTSGTTQGAAQLVYVPIINIMSDDVPPPTTRLNLPGHVVPTAIAATRDPDPSSPTYILTDLYAIGGKSLFRLSAEASGKDQATADTLLTYDILSGTDTLIAMTFDGVTYLWGKNGSNVAYYLSCLTEDVDKPGSWSAPVPILTGIERISAYVNRKDGGNTIFAAGGGRLYRLTQATDTSGKLWKAQSISVASPPELPAHTISSYTTTLKVTGQDGLPAKDVKLSVTAQTRIPVYVNGLYYILSRTPVELVTNSLGTVTIIEAVDSIYATCLAVSLEGAATTAINPMDGPFAKLSALNSKEALKNASFPTNIQAGGLVGPAKTAPLVDQETSDDELKKIAANMDAFKEIYGKANESRRLRSPLKRAARVVPATAYRSHQPRSGGGFFGISFGDIWQWLKSGVEAIIRIVKHAAKDIWYFVAEIAGDVYQAVLDTVEAVMGAIEWVFNAIKTVIEDIIRFIKFLLDWDDIRRTKDVLHNVVMLYLRDKVDGIHDAKGIFDKTIMQVEDSISAWAGIEDWSPLGQTASNPPALEGSDPTKDQTAGSQLFADHYRNNVNNLSLKGSEPSQDVVQMLIDELLAAISNEGAVLSAVYHQLMDLAHDFDSMSVGDILKRLAGILINGILSSVQVVGDALLNVLASLSSLAVELLDTKIHIPVISDILNAIGIPDISFMDLFTWIAAVAYTVVYKIANDEAPFPDNASTKALIDARTWSEITSQFSRSLMTNGEVDSKGVLRLPDGLSKAIYIAGHAISGFMTLVGNFVTIFEATSPSGENPFSLPSAILGIISAGFGGVADALVPMEPISDTIVSSFSTVLTTVGILSKIIFSGFVQKRLAAKSSNFNGLAVNDGRATGAVINAVLVIPELFCTCWHFGELSKKPESAARSAAIVGEVSKLCSYVGRVSYAFAVNDKNPETKIIEVGVMVVGNTTAGGCQTAIAFIH